MARSADDLLSTLTSRCGYSCGGRPDRVASDPQEPLDDPVGRILTARAPPGPCSTGPTPLGLVHVGDPALRVVAVTRQQLLQRRRGGGRCPPGRSPTTSYSGPPVHPCDDCAEPLCPTAPSRRRLARRGRGPANGREGCRSPGTQTTFCTSDCETQESENIEVEGISTACCSFRS